MQVKFLGAAGTVTGSSYVLTSDSGKSILIDLGMFQGTAAVDALNYKSFEYDCSKLSGAILTHAHLDHCGRLPILLDHGFSGNIWMTAPTRELTELSLLDSAKIAKQDDKQVLYDKSLALRTFKRFVTADYHEEFEIADFGIRMYDAGHILGSASLEIEDRASKSGMKKIVFSGDLGNSPEDLVQPTEYISDADAVIMESTYGDRLHPDEDPTELIASEIQAVEKSGGVMLLPAFSLERTQDLLHIIMHLKKEGKVKADTTVFLDGPMAQKATDIYLDYPQFFNEHIQKELSLGSPFRFDGLNIIGSWQESQDIHMHPGPKVIIAGSGMMSGGRIVGHAAVYLPRSSTRLCIVGYQAEETLGRQLLEGSREVSIEGSAVSVLASVSSTRAMSSHADQKLLLDWLKNIKNVKKVFLTHGEDSAREVLSEKVKSEVHIDDVVLPLLNQEMAV